MNYDYKANYKSWLDAPEVDEATKAELLDITDEKEIEDRFYRDLNFGTAGLRGVIGAGSNRMNNYVVRRATQGIADYIIKHAGSDGASRGVAISYDSRYFSDTFAKETALVFAANGIKAYLFDELKPTPELSFAVRHLGAIAGINITASHNPSEYNGYKVYWEDGGQIPPHVSDAVLEYINNTPIFSAKRIEEDEAKAKGLLVMIGEDVDKAFLENVYKQSILKGNVPEDFKLVYTPLHGTGRKLVSRILEMAGFKCVAKVPAQELPDGGFPTVSAPNPENRECFDLAFIEAEKIGADLIIATDPDADRVGIAVKTEDGEFVTLSGNQVGAMLTHYILTARKEKGMLPDNAAVISTIVSTNMTKAICEKFGVKFIETLTGFKFIGEKILEFEKTGSNEFMLGFEESYGYLSGTYARDKDAVVASMLIAEMAAYYASKGVTLYEEMKNMYKTYGGYAEETVSITMPGIDGLAKIQKIMSDLRTSKPEKIGDFDVLALRDYSAGVRYDLVNKTEEKLTLPKADVLYFELADGVNFVARPSGTEPKIKLYYLTSGACENCASKKLEKIKNTVKSVYFA